MFLHRTCVEVEKRNCLKMEGEGICRTCLKTTDKLMPLFQTPLLVFKIVAIAPVEVTKM